MNRGLQEIRRVEPEETLASPKELMTYQNPVLPQYFADPFVFRHGGEYFAVGTGPAEGGVMPMARSLDLVEWTVLPGAIRSPDPALGTDYWAPEIAEHNGTFYLYHSVGFGDKRHKLRVATSDRPEGPYVDAGVNLIDPEQCDFAIDGHPFQDVDGQWYFFYARDFLDSSDGHRPGTALVMDRMVSMTELAGEERLVLRATSDWQRFQNERPMYAGVYDWHTLEGPFVREHGGRYYCFYSGGRWETDFYGVDYAVAPHPLGPWSAEPVEFPRVLRRVPGHVVGPGHNSVVVGPDGVTDFCVYHAWDVAMTARRMCIDPIAWTDSGPRCLGPTWTPQTI